MIGNSSWYKCFFDWGKFQIWPYRITPTADLACIQTSAGHPIPQDHTSVTSNDSQHLRLCLEHAKIVKMKWSWSATSNSYRSFRPCQSFWSFYTKPSRISSWIPPATNPMPNSLNVTGLPTLQWRCCHLPKEEITIGGYVCLVTATAF